MVWVLIVMINMWPGCDTSGVLCHVREARFSMPSLEMCQSVQQMHNPAFVTAECWGKAKGE